MEKISTWGSPARPIAIAHTKELFPVPFGPITRLSRDPGLDFMWS